jgi:hypothetical protein
MVLIVAAGVVACTPKRVREEPILKNGDRIPTADAAIVEASQRGEADRERIRAERDSLAAEALARCSPGICEAIARGEVVLGMNEVEVFAATGTTPDAWSIRHAGNGMILVPASLDRAPRDAVGQVAMVQLRGGRVSSYSYREAQGIRLVDEARDATTTGRADAVAEALIREGDDLVARGDLKGALDRYDRASILRAGDPLLDYRIATVLDKQLRPIEALIQYRLFLHRLELEKIEAVGDAYAKLADAIAHARERVIVLEKHER